jgi:hypothetical protein
VELAELTGGRPCAAWGEGVGVGRGGTSGLRSARGTTRQPVLRRLRILEHKPKLPAELFRIYQEASAVQPDDPKGTEDEMRAAVIDFERLVGHPII